MTGLPQKASRVESNTESRERFEWFSEVFVKEVGRFGVDFWGKCSDMAGSSVLVGSRDTFIEGC